MVDALSMHAVFVIAISLFELALAGLLVFHVPSDRARRLVALALVGHVALRANIFSNALGFSEDVTRTAANTYDDVGDAAAFVFLAFMVFFPERVRLRSWHGAVATFALVFYSIGPLIRFLAPELATGNNASNMMQETFGPFAGGFGRGFVNAALLFSCLVRIRAGPADRRRGDTLVAIAMTISLFTRLGVYLVGLAALVLGIPHRFVPFATLADVAGDPGGIAVAGYAVSRVVLPIALTVWIAGRMHMRTAWLIVLVGGAVSILGDFGELGFIEESEMLAPFLIGYAMFHHGALGFREVPTGAALGMATASGLAAFLLVDAATLSIVGDAPLGPSLGILLGLVACIAAAAVMLPGLRRARIPRTLTITTSATDPLTEVAAPEAGALLWGRYRIAHLLGEGGQGRAYLAHDTSLRRDVVLKFVAGEARALLREARAASALDHPNVVRVLDVRETPTQSVLILEYVEGGSLRARLARGRPPPREAARLAIDILGGLAAAHEQGIVHRDIKPENVLLTRSGLAKIGDFGTARPQGAGATAMSMPSGTLPYMSPEQLRGAPASAATDVYATGVVLHEILTGRLPVDVRMLDDFEARRRIVGGIIALGAELGALEPVVRRALALDVLDRFASAEEMAHAIEKVVPELPA